MEGSMREYARPRLDWSNTLSIVAVHAAANASPSASRRRMCPAEPSCLKRIRPNAQMSGSNGFLAMLRSFRSPGAEHKVVVFVGSEDVGLLAHMAACRAGRGAGDRFSGTVVDGILQACQPEVAVHEIQGEFPGQPEAAAEFLVVYVTPGEKILVAEPIVIGRVELLESAGTAAIRGVFRA